METTTNVTMAQAGISIMNKEQIEVISSKLDFGLVLVPQIIWPQL